ncbi:MAG TPA: metallophosphoesterase [Candidatus Saccharimonadales bacterium]|nr:metallophosphoesterase [Candidatus Saccharimonadales bacterium]
MDANQELIQAAPEADIDDGPDWLLHAKQVGAVALLAGTTFIGGFAAGIMLPTHAELGPHDSTVQLTLDNRATVDLGPIGSISTKSPLGLGPIDIAGVKVTVKQIPDGDGSTLGAGEIRQYEQFFTEPGRRALQESATDALVERGMQAGGIVTSVTLLGYWLLQPKGREAIAKAASSRRSVCTALLAAGALTLSGSSALGGSVERPENQVLASVGVHDVSIDGKVLETLVNKYGPQAINYIRDLDTYYNEIEDNLFSALAAAQKAEAADKDGLAHMIESGKAESALWISDNHCNTETAAIAADVAQKIDAAFVLDSGDQTMGGTEAERLCVSILPQRLGSEIPIVVSLGNHDDRQVTARMDRELGYTVLEGKPTKVKGYTFVGDSDVMRSAFNVPYRQDGFETLAEQGERLANTACSASGIDIVMAHEPAAGLPAAEQTCAPLVISGHTHQATEPKVFVTPDGQRVTYQMVNGTTGGAAPDKMTFESKLGQDATMIQLVFDKSSKAPLGYRSIVLHPDKTVTIGALVPFVPPEKSQAPAGSPGQSVGATKLSTK